MSSCSINCSSPTIPPFPPPSECADALQMFQSPLVPLVHFGHILVASLTILLSLLVLHQYWRLRIVLHANLAILFANILLLYMANATAHLVSKARHQFLFATQSPASDPCRLLTPIWLSIGLLAPNYVYSVAFPLFHFAIMLERMRATIWLRHYEYEGLSRWTIRGILLVWTLALGYISYVVCTSLQDPKFGHPQAAIQLTSDANAGTIIAVTNGTFLLIVLACLGDWLILRENSKQMRNRKRANSADADYSLSRNYQLSENLLCMRLILPLDLSYALLYSLYSALILIIRLWRKSMPPAQYIFLYDSAMLLLFLHNIVTLAIYARFIRFTKRCRQRTVQVEPMPDQFEMYFKELEAQWS